jgi:hypothetical protein
MSIKWYCDLCGHEITEQPFAVTAFAQGLDRNLASPGAPEPLLGIHADEACARNLAAQLKEALKRATPEKKARR